MTAGQEIEKIISREIADYAAGLLQESELKEAEKQQITAMSERLGESDRQRKLAEYVEWLYQENSKHNLIGPAEKKEIVYLHVMDSLIPLFYLSRYIELTGRIGIDIGSGAGLPGLLWGIVLPESIIYLLDSRRKRVEFLREAVSVLDIDNCRPLRARAERLGQDKDWRGKFDFVLARAVASLDVLLEYSLPLLKIKGRALLFKGPGYQEELEAGDSAAALLKGVREEIYSFRVPGLKGKRFILSYQKENFSPEKFPRRVGIPKKRPLGGRS